MSLNLQLSQGRVFVNATNVFPLPVEIQWNNSVLQALYHAEHTFLQI